MKKIISSPSELSVNQQVQLKKGSLIETVVIIRKFSEWAQAVTKCNGTLRCIESEDFAEDCVWVNMKPATKPFKIPSVFITGRTGIADALKKSLK